MFAPDDNTARNAQNLPDNVTAQGAAITALTSRVTGDTGNSYIGSLVSRIHEPSTTRLKMRLECTVEGNDPENPLVHATFRACTKSEDPSFGKYTPSGHLAFSVIPEIAAKLEVGRFYHLDMSVVPE